MNTATILGISEEITTCDCCGKSNLKRTVALKLNGDVVHYGCDCASKAFRSAAMQSYKWGRPSADKIRQFAEASAKYGSVYTLTA